MRKRWRPAAGLAAAMQAGGKAPTQRSFFRNLSSPFDDLYSDGDRMFGVGSDGLIAVSGDGTGWSSLPRLAPLPGRPRGSAPLPAAGIPRARGPGSLARSPGPRAPGDAFHGLRPRFRRPQGPGALSARLDPSYICFKWKT